MKKSIIISLLIATIATALTAVETVETPVQFEFADKLVSVFGGSDNILSKAETIRVLEFLQADLPEQTSVTAMANRLSRHNNVQNAARGDLTEERFSIREIAPELYVVEFIQKYDVNADKYVTKAELANALEHVIGTPKINSGINKGSVAKR